MGYIQGINRVLIGLLANQHFSKTFVATGGNKQIPILPKRLLKTISVMSPVDINLSLGTTLAGTELLDSFPCAANVETTIDIGFYSNLQYTLYFSGLAAATTVVRYYML